MVPHPSQEGMPVEKHLGHRIELQQGYQKPKPIRILADGKRYAPPPPLYEHLPADPTEQHFASLHLPNNQAVTGDLQMREIVSETFPLIVPDQDLIQHAPMIAGATAVVTVSSLQQLDLWGSEIMDDDGEGEDEQTVRRTLKRQRGLRSPSPVNQIPLEGQVQDSRIREDLGVYYFIFVLKHFFNEDSTYLNFFL